MSVNLLTMDRTKAFELCAQLFGGYANQYQEYLKNARPETYYSVISIAAAAPAQQAFFQNPAWPLGNHQSQNKLGQFFFIGNDVRLVPHEVAKPLTTKADIASLAANWWLDINIAGRPVVSSLPAFLFLKGLGVPDFTAAAPAYFEGGWDNGSEHHTLIPYMPDQQITATLTPDANVVTPTVAYKVKLIMHGWSFKRVADA